MEWNWEMNVQEGLLALAVAALGGYRDTRDMCVLMAVIYCDERMQEKSAKGKVHRVKS